MKCSEIRGLLNKTKTAYEEWISMMKKPHLSFASPKEQLIFFEAFCTEHFPRYLNSNSYTGEDSFKTPSI